MRDSFSLSESVSWLNWGLCLERGIVRISTSSATPWVRRMPMKSSSVRVECPIVRISTEGMLKLLSGGSRLLFMELWNILNAETVVYSQQQRDELEGSVSISLVYRGKLDYVLFVHVYAAILSHTHRLPPV